MNKDNVYRKLAERVNFPKSRYIRMVFERLLTPEDAAMVLSLPATADEFATNHHLSYEEAVHKLTGFTNKGVAIPFEKDGVRKYLCVSNVIQVHDATIHAIINKKYSPSCDEIIEIWKQFRETEWFEVVRDMEEKGRLSGRAIPAWSSVADEPDLQPFDNLRVILKNAPGIAVVDCPCRWLQVQRGECDKPTFVCVSLSAGSVKYIVDQGIGKKLTLEEGYKLLEECEQAGLIATTNATTPRDMIKQLCFCETNECIILRPQVKYGYKLWAPSRFQAQINQDVCKGCRSCRQRCYFQAIEMHTAKGKRKAKAQIDPEKCFGCGLCVITCPTKAISMKLVRPVEYLA